MVHKLHNLWVTNMAQCLDFALGYLCIHDLLHRDDLTSLTMPSTMELRPWTFCDEL